MGSTVENFKAQEISSLSCLHFQVKFFELDDLR